MLKVAIILENFSIGGAQRVVSELVKNINPQQIQILVLCLFKRKDTDLARAAEEKANVRYLDIQGKNLIANYRRVAMELSNFKPDVIHAHLVGQLYSVPYGLIHQKPVVITAHTKPEKAFIKKIEPLIRYGIKKKKMWIVSVSNENQKLVTKYFSSAASQCVCINNGIDTGAFYGKPHPYFTYINVARQDENKNQAAILRCFKKIYNENKLTRLILAGDGPCHEKLMKEAAVIGLSGVVFFPGEVSNVSEYYAVSDAYVQSSHREAMPMSVLEAMAAGLPIISTDVGGLHDVIRDNGALVADEDEDALYHAMRSLLDSPDDEIAMMKTASLLTADRYSSKKMAEEYTELYKRLVEKG